MLLLLCAVMFYILVIMGDSPKTNVDLDAFEASSSPLASLPQSTLHFSAGDLAQAEVYLNAPVLKLSAACGWQLDSITVTDTVPDGIAAQVREIRLRYVDPASGSVVAVSSITPSLCLRSLPARGFYAGTDQEWMIGGMKGVLMRKGSTVNLHARQGEIVYQMEGDIEADTMRYLSGMIEL